jgi:hypothetical protein
VNSKEFTPRTCVERIPDPSEPEALEMLHVGGDAHPALARAGSGHGSAGVITRIGRAVAADLRGSGYVRTGKVYLR